MSGERENAPKEGTDSLRDAAMKSAAPAAGASVFVISAPSGAGKTTLIKRLRAASPRLRFSISFTTRKPRRGERNGRDYFFVSPEVFAGKIAQGEFLEWADVGSHRYGTERKQLQAAQEAGCGILLDIDVQGHARLRGSLPEAVSIFVLPPSYEELKRRLYARGKDTQEEIVRRLKTAHQEITHWPEYDYLVVNDHLQEATRKLRAIVLAASDRRSCQKARAEEIVRTFGG